MSLSLHLVLTLTSHCFKDKHSEQSKELFASCFIKYSPLQTKLSDARLKALTEVLLTTYVLSLLGLVDPEDEGTTILRNVGKYLPIDKPQLSTALRSR